ncbi:hypothetical protein Bbelb_200760 [Branchiostoma belcheri]|nr:hypothetical protein Bbelb_200760 [Branchiostoma belcheri]
MERYSAFSRGTDRYSAFSRGRDRYSTLSTHNGRDRYNASGRDWYSTSSTHKGRERYSASCRGRDWYSTLGTHKGRDRYNAFNTHKGRDMYGSGLVKQQPREYRKALNPSLIESLEEACLLVLVRYMQLPCNMCKEKGCSALVIQEPEAKPVGSGIILKWTLWSQIQETSSQLLYYSCLGEKLTVWLLVGKDKRPMNAFMVWG